MCRRLLDQVNFCYKPDAVPGCVCSSKHIHLSAMKRLKVFASWQKNVILCFFVSAEHVDYEGQGWSSWLSDSFSLSLPICLFLTTPLAALGGGTHTKHFLIFSSEKKRGFFWTRHKNECLFLLFFRKTQQKRQRRAKGNSFWAIRSKFARNSLRKYVVCLFLRNGERERELCSCGTDCHLIFFKGPRPVCPRILREQPLEHNADSWHSPD